MNIIFLLAPVSVLLGLVAVGAFVWTLRSGQYEDIEGAAARILIEDDDVAVSPEPGDAGAHPHRAGRFSKAQGVPPSGCG